MSIVKEPSLLSVVEELEGIRRALEETNDRLKVIQEWHEEEGAALAEPLSSVAEDFRFLASFARRLNVPAWLLKR